MEPPTAQSLAQHLERIIAANHDEPLTIAPEDYAKPIVELEIGSLDLIEWAFELEEEFELEIDDDGLVEFVAFSLLDTERWLRDQIAVTA